MRTMRIRFLLLLVALFIASVGTLHAQEDISHLTTEKGLTIPIPAGWTVFGPEGESFSLADDEGIADMSVMFRDDIEIAYGYRPGSLDDLLIALSETTYLEDVTMDELRMEKRASAVLLVQPYTGAYIVGALIVAQYYRGDYATFTLTIVDENFERRDEFIEAAINLLDTVAFPVPEIVIQPPLLPAAMPAAKIVFSTGARIDLPEGWRFAAPDQPVEFIAELLSPDERVRVTLEVAEEPARSIDEIRRSVGPRLAAEIGDEDFDAAAEFLLMTLPEGQPLLTYDSRVFGPDEGGAALLYQLIAGEYGVLQMTTRADDPDALDEVYGELMEMLTSYDTSQIEVAGGRPIDCLARADLLLGDELGVSLLVRCPAGCAEGVVWGTDIYTDDSAICTAAIHAGLIPVEGGSVRVTLTGAREIFIGSQRNGITTQAYGPWGGSYTLSAPEE